MTLLVRARDLIGRPVVTLDGDDIAQIKDIVYAESTGAVVGFTLAGRTLLSGPMRETLPWKHVHAVGRHAVMITGRDALADPDGVDTGAGPDSDVLGDTVLTRGGTALGTVVDVIIDAGPDAHSPAGVVGFEITTSDALPPRGRRALIPRPDTYAASGEAIIVADSATDFVANDLAGFGSAVASWRASAHRDS
jgi:sporulation protein YlmC with PRC-barrel domain